MGYNREELEPVRCAIVRCMDKSTGRIIGDRVRRLRAEAHMSQEEVGEALPTVGHRPLTQAAISSIENGAKLPTPNGLIALARLFETSADYLLGLTDNAMSAADIESELRRGGLGGRLGDVFQTLSLPHRETVYLVAQGLAALEGVERGDDELTAQIAVVASSLVQIFGRVRAGQIFATIADSHPHLGGALLRWLESRSQDSAQLG